MEQVDSPGDTEYNGAGFRSDISTRGNYSHTFTVAGDYNYIAGGFGDIGEEGGGYL